MKGMKLTLALVVAALSLPAQAQMANVTDITKLAGASSGTIGTSAVLVVPQVIGGGVANAANYAGIPSRWSTLFLANAGAPGGAIISCGFTSSIALEGAGTFSLPPQQSLWWPPGTPPQNLPIYCIAAAASTPFSAVVGAQ